MTDLTADQILAADDLKTEDVEVPEWGGTVTVRTMTGNERDQFETMLQSLKKVRGVLQVATVKARIVQLTAVNGDGSLLFTPEQIEKLNTKSAGAIDKVYQVAQRLNHLLPGDVEELAGE